MARCTTCNGAGSVMVSTKCNKCLGTGEIVDYDEEGNEQLELCPECEDGLIFSEELCHTCHGTGEVWPFRTDPFNF